jgi:hypothetical protein
MRSHSTATRDKRLAGLGRGIRQLEIKNQAATWSAAIIVQVELATSQWRTDITRAGGGAFIPILKSVYHLSHWSI